MRCTLIIFSLFLGFALRAQTTDPFAPYLTGRSPVIAEEMGVEMHSDSIRVRKLVFRGRDNSTVFAAIAYPAGNGPFPGMLRLHGGGGFADIPAAVSSAKSGYVSLVLDQPGVAGEKSRNARTSGIWKGRAMITAKPDVTHSALFDAVLASVQALYLLRALPEVDKNKLCVAGASWGGYIATMVAALCNKDINATWSVFGSGHFEKGAYEKDRIMKLPEEERARWQRWLDPGSRAHQITKPYFISTASNDRHWSWMAVQATLAEMKGPVNQFYSPNDNHAMNYPGAKYMVHYFNHYVKGTGPKLPVITGQRNVRQTVYFKVLHTSDPVKAEVWYAPSDTVWTQKKWTVTTAVKQGDHFVATLPANQKLNWYPVIRSVYGKDTIASSGLIRDLYAALPPVVFNASETAGPGSVFGLQGACFGPAPELWYGTSKPAGKLNIISASDRNITGQLPDTIKQQVVTVWIKNDAGFSKPVYLNKARAMSLEFDELQPGQAFRIFGRNLADAAVQLQAVKGGTPLTAVVKSSGDYILSCIAPAALKKGAQYRVLVNGSAAEELITGRAAGKDPFRLNMPWGSDFTFSQNVYNVRTDVRLLFRASGDGIANDRQAIQQAIDLASRNGGGVVFLPAGKYRLDIPSGSGLIMRSRVVLQGDGPDNTIIQYGFGTPPPYTNPIGKGGWPDSTTDGVAVLWPLQTTLSGLCDLQVQNVNTSGIWRHSLKNMRPPVLKPGAAGSKFFVANCKFDLSVAWGLSWGYVDRMVITGCWFESHAQATWPWMWHCNGSTNFVVRNNRFTYSAGRFGFNEAYNGIIENNHITRLGDLQTAKGETGGFNIDFSSDIIVLNNRMDVTGRDIEYHNQGETILSQGYDSKNMDAGIASSATATTISDVSKNWKQIRTENLSSSDVVAIVDGTGAGQWRRIVKNNANTITVSQPWDLIPDASSHYVITGWSAEDWLVKGNILEGNNRGIWFYCGNTDVSIVDNKLINSEGIYIRADQRLAQGRYNLSWNTYVADNIVINNNGMRPAFICNTLAVVSPDSLHGLGSIGIDIRRNYVEAFRPNSRSFVRGEGYFNEVNAKFKVRGSTIGVIGTIFEQNKVVNADSGYRFSSLTAQTVIKESVFRNVKANDTNAIFMSLPAGDPFSKFLDGKAPPVTRILSDSGGIRRLLFHSRHVNGIPTLIHAAVIRPAAPGNHPGLLVLHGGGGSAEIEKGIKWAQQGYIVVTLDLPGIADGKKLKYSSGHWKEMAYGSNRFTHINNSTIFDAVLAALQGLYLLRDQPGVTSIGITGVSWGGYMTTMLSGLAPSYISAAFSSYGSGFYDSGSVFMKDLDAMRVEERAAWLHYLDAGRRAKYIAAPFFIAAASNDNWFYPPAVQATLNSIDAPCSHFFAANANHAAPVPGGNSTKERVGTMEMELAYFNYYLKGAGSPLPAISNEITKDAGVQFHVESKTVIKNVSVHYSTDSSWTKRKWQAAAAFPVKGRPGWYEATLPDSVRAKGSYWFASVSDETPFTVSGKMIPYE